MSLKYLENLHKKFIRTRMHFLSIIFFFFFFCYILSFQILYFAMQLCPLYWHLGSWESFFCVYIYFYIWNHHDIGRKLIAFLPLFTCISHYKYVITTLFHKYEYDNSFNTLVNFFKRKIKSSGLNQYANLGLFHLLAQAIKPWLWGVVLFPVKTQT